jgi:hypothetical protein
LDGAPVFFGNQNPMTAFAGDVNRLVGLCGVVEKAIELLPDLARRHRAHKKVVSSKKRTRLRTLYANFSDEKTTHR